MKTYNKSDFHNPEQLTRQQVWAEYRLLLPEEVDGRFGFKSNGKGQTRSVTTLAWLDHLCNRKDWTYRVPLATPLPDGTVLSSNECCFSDAPAMSDDEHFAMMNSARISQSLPPSYLDAILAAAKRPKPRLYLAGPMSSHPDDFNFPAFFKAAAELEQQGYEVINPAQMDLDRGYSPERLKQLSPAEHQQFLKEAVKLDLDAIQTCQAIAMLPGWESSKGAKAELALAQWLGLDVIYLDGRGQPDADGWIAHVPGDPMPCDGATQIEFLDGNGYYYSDINGNHCNEQDWWGKEYPVPIVKWRPAQPKQPYNSDERAEWSIGDSTATSTAQYASDDPKGAAGALKAPMWLLPGSATKQTAWVHKLGAEKYGIFNWRQTGVCASTYISAIMRHLDQWRDGEDLDAESGYSHIAHIAASCNILMDAQHCGKLRDDRNKV